MNISSLTPIKQLPKPEEVSHLRSPRDSATAYNAWRREGEIVKGYNQVIQIVNQLNREVEKLSERRKLDFDMFPFKIYNLPSELQSNPFTNNWLNFNIRGGYVFTSRVDTGSCFVNGTDRMEPFSYKSTIPPAVTKGQYTIPSSSYHYWFWIETSGSSSSGSVDPLAVTSGSNYYLRASNNPQTPDNLFNPNGWQNWPTASAGNFIIGFVDSATSAAANIAIIRQIQVGDVLSAGSPLPAPKLFTVCENGSLESWYLYGFRSGSA